MTPKLIASGLAAILMLSAGAAAAQGPRERPDLAAMDTDGDGAVSLEEMTAHAQSRTAERVAQMFARLDADGDGVISAAEIEAAQDRRGHWQGRVNRPGRPAGD